MSRLVVLFLVVALVATCCAFGASARRMLKLENSPTFEEVENESPTMKEDEKPKKKDDFELLGYDPKKYETSSFEGIDEIENLASSAKTMEELAKKIEERGYITEYHALNLLRLFGFGPGMATVRDKAMVEKGVLFFRNTGKASLERIKQGYPTKAHDVMEKSLKKGTLGDISKLYNFLCGEPEPAECETHKDQKDPVKIAVTDLMDALENEFLKEIDDPEVVQYVNKKRQTYWHYLDFCHRFAIRFIHRIKPFEGFVGHWRKVSVPPCVSLSESVSLPIGLWATHSNFFVSDKSFEDAFIPYQGDEDGERHPDSGAVRVSGMLQGRVMDEVPPIELHVPQKFISKSPMRFPAFAREKFTEKLTKDVLETLHLKHVKPLSILETIVEVDEDNLSSPGRSSSVESFEKVVPQKPLLMIEGVKPPSGEEEEDVGAKGIDNEIRDKSWMKGAKEVDESDPRLGDVRFKSPCGEHPHDNICSSVLRFETVWYVLDALILESYEKGSKLVPAPPLNEELMSVETAEERVDIVKSFATEWEKWEYYWQDNADQFLTDTSLSFKTFPFLTGDYDLLMMQSCFLTPTLPSPSYKDQQQCFVAGALSVFEAFSKQEFPFSAEKMEKDLLKFLNNALLRGTLDDKSSAMEIGANPQDEYRRNNVAMQMNAYRVVQHGAQASYSSYALRHPKEDVILPLLDPDFPTLAVSAAGVWEIKATDPRPGSTVPPIQHKAEGFRRFLQIMRLANADMWKDGVSVHDKFLNIFFPVAIEKYRLSELCDSAKAELFKKQFEEFEDIEIPSHWDKHPLADPLYEWPTEDVPLIVRLVSDSVDAINSLRRPEIFGADKDFSPAVYRYVCLLYGAMPQVLLEKSSQLKLKISALCPLLA